TSWSPRRHPAMRCGRTARPSLGRSSPRRLSRSTPARGRSGSSSFPAEAPPMRRPAVLVLSLGVALGATLDTARAQTSASYKLTESVVNAGGDPRDASFAASASYRIRLDAIGQSVAGAGFTSAGYHMNAGFAGDYPPPGEVLNVRWSTPALL